MAMANFTGNPQARQMGRKQFYNPDMDPQQNLQLATMLGEHLDRVQRQEQQGNRDPGLDSLVMAMANAGAVNQQNIAQKQVAQADMTARTGEANANRSLQGQLAQLQADTQGKVLAQQETEHAADLALKTRELNSNQLMVRVNQAQ